MDYWMGMLEKGDLYYIDEQLFTYRYHLTSGTAVSRTNLEFPVDVVRIADKYRRYMSRDQISQSDVAKRIAHRMLQFLDRVLLHGGSGDIEQYLEPCPIDFQREDLSELDALHLEVHDFKRATCCAMLYTHQLYMELFNLGQRPAYGAEQKVGAKS